MNQNNNDNFNNMIFSKLTEIIEFAGKADSKLNEIADIKNSLSILQKALSEHELKNNSDMEKVFSKIEELDKRAISASIKYKQELVGIKDDIITVSEDVKELGKK